MNKSNLAIVGLLLVILGLIYFNRISSTKLAQKDVALKAVSDTLHSYKNTVGGQGAYIAVVNTDKKNLQALLETQVQKNGLYNSILDSLKSNKNIQAASVITSTNSVRYVHVTDTLYKNIVYDDTLHTKWYDAGIHVNKGKLNFNLDTREELNLTTSKKDNKGWFTGSTLTTYASSANPDVRITGLVSTSTVVDKRKPRIGAFIGPALVTDKNLKVNAGIAVGVGITF